MSKRRLAPSSIEGFVTLTGRQDSSRLRCHGGGPGDQPEPSCGGRHCGRLRRGGLRGSCVHSQPTLREAGAAAAVGAGRQAAEKVQACSGRQLGCALPAFGFPRHGYSAAIPFLGV
jgi:hypothetical protein